MLEKMEEKLNDSEMNWLINDYGLFAGTREKRRNRGGEKRRHSQVWLCTDALRRMCLGSEDQRRKRG